MKQRSLVVDVVVLAIHLVDIAVHLKELLGGLLLKMLILLAGLIVGIFDGASSSGQSWLGSCECYRRQTGQDLG